MKLRVCECGRKEAAFWVGDDGKYRCYYCTYKTSEEEEERESNSIDDDSEEINEDNTSPFAH